MKVLSIRQPWAWLIVNGYKDIENRTWWTSFRGPALIHAGKAMTADEYDDVEEFIRFSGKIALPLPPANELLRGGIVGIAEIIDCVQRSDSDWFFGPYGFVLRNARPLPFYPMRGMLGFFEAPSHFKATV